MTNKLFQEDILKYKEQIEQLTKNKEEKEKEIIELRAENENLKKQKKILNKEEEEKKNTLIT